MNHVYNCACEGQNHYCVIDLRASFTARPLDVIKYTTVICQVMQYSDRAFYLRLRIATLER